MYVAFQPEDRKKFFDAIRRLENELGRSHKSASRQAARQILSSLAKITKVAPTHRKYIKLGKSRTGKTTKFKVITKHTKHGGTARRWSAQGAWRRQIIYAKNVRELKKRPAMIIAMRGVAQQSWKQAGRKGRINVGVGKEETAKRRAGIMKKAARRWVDYNEVKGPNGMGIAISNRMRHIEDALIGGRTAVSQTMATAARGLNKAVERELKRRATRV